MAARELPVVVAVGEKGSGRAVEWAAAEASARRCELRVVHVERLRWAVDPAGLVPVADFSSYRAVADDLLRAAVGRARTVASDIDVSARNLFGSTVPVLSAVGHGAQLLVLGSRHGPDTHGLRGLLSPSACATVATHAGCPVVVVPQLRSGPSEGAPPSVVVGVDGTGSCTAAVAFAFRAAAQRSVSVTAVHAWSLDRPADHEAVSGPAAAAEAAARRVVDRALALAQEQFADVPAHVRLVCGDPAGTLVRASEGAALVVVGSRGRGTARAAAFGSVSRRVALQARCPAVVVRSGKSGKDTGFRAGRRTIVPLTDVAGSEAVQRRRTPGA